VQQEGWAPRMEYDELPERDYPHSRINMPTQEEWAEQIDRLAFFKHLFVGLCLITLLVVICIVVMAITPTPAM